MPDAGFLAAIDASLDVGQLEEAEMLLDRALAQCDDFFLYYERKGDLLRRQDRLGEARANYLRALSLEPGAEWIRAKLTDRSRTCGCHDRLPDSSTGHRKAEGGRRLRGELKSSRPGVPLVSVVTAVYDNPDSLERCLASVAAQTYSNVEHIVVDGGSPQSTLDILAAHDASLDYYVSEPDSGIYAAMNKGLSLARGDYICLLNSDDTQAPDFVRRSVEHALAQSVPPDIVYSDFFDGDTRLPAQPLNPGIMLGNLNVNHCTFLVTRNCYDEIGRYDETLSIVSDMQWIRRAFTADKRFSLLPEAHFHFSQGGASSGNSPERRTRIIAENGICYRRDFPFLDQQEAETLYLLRFGPSRLEEAAEIYRRHSNRVQFRAAFRAYLEHCFRDRAAFRLPQSEADGLFGIYITLADELKIDRKHIHIKTKKGDFSDLLHTISCAPSKPKEAGSKRILHYVTEFSAPSETFIYDLIERLDASTPHDNFVLYQKGQLREERPWSKEFGLDWPHFRPEVSREILRYIIENREIDIVVAHFAINAHRLQDRATQIGAGSLLDDLPILVMTHGIDVFKLRENDKAYRDFVRHKLGDREDVAFTSVSEYLRGELISGGVPREKVTIVPNVVNEIFYRHRKNGNYYDRSRRLQLLSIGRLIKWKGHHHLIEALVHFRRSCTDQFDLTIVYGGGDDELLALTELTARLGLTDNVHFERFVDFRSDPGFFARFDLYVHPSTYTEDASRKSETFGVAVLEAISAGLPVISSNAGGLPEVIGTTGPHAHIVPHGDTAALAHALVHTWQSGVAFSDNRAYAQERLAAFSPAEQTEVLDRVIRNLTRKRINAALLTSATIGGAGYAAYRVHRGLSETACVKPRIYTTNRTHQDRPGVRFVAHPSGDGNRWRDLQLRARPGYTIFTINQTSLRSRELLRMVKDADVINLHYYARFLSVENIATLTNLGKPVVMTIRDMNPITGGCHFFHGCNRWQNDCSNCPQIPSAYTNYPAAVLRAKRQYYNFSNLTLVALSDHTRQIVKRAPYFNRCRIETIPNSIETDIFRPYDKSIVRRELGLPLDRKIIGYVPSYSSEVKGYREVTKAFQKLRGAFVGDEPFVMLVGGDTPATREICLDRMSLGYLSDNNALARAYSAADVVVVPSLEETFSNTTAEAISCGVPVVGFKTGAIPDLVRSGETGCAVELGDVDGLAEGLLKVLTGPDLSSSCRKLAEEVLSFELQAHRYEALFRELTLTSCGKSSSAPLRVFDCIEELGFGLASIAAEKAAACRG
ncbi:glycosyltransferase [Roseivivax isoporae]|uniref:glycosyltransferase n=1 Tax=Roseivivax isoporae TaxID=591206 RepID=UPI0004B78B7B|nr:glycosyltransferase [Roseivivax isoporae]